MQLKDITHMFCSLMSSYKIYKECAFSFDFTLKIMCHLEWAKKSLSLKEKLKIK
jgi:hypothetical protein